jgi:hypothetical protein
LAYSDKTWRSGDAARVILGAGIVVYTSLSLQYKELCPMGVLLGLVPFTLSMQIAHTIGTLCRSGKHDEVKSAWPSRLRRINGQFGVGGTICWLWVSQDA